MKSPSNNSEIRPTLDLHSMKTECFSYILSLEFKKLLRYSFKAFFSGGPKRFLKKRKKKVHCPVVLKKMEARR